MTFDTALTVAFSLAVLVTAAVVGANAIEWLDDRKRRRLDRERFQRWLAEREREEHEPPRRYRRHGGGL